MTPNETMTQPTTAELTSEEVVRITRETNYGTWRFQKGWNPLHIVDSEGCYIIDANGKRYLDFFSAADVHEPRPQKSGGHRLYRETGTGAGIRAARLHNHRSRRTVEAAA